MLFFSPTFSAAYCTIPPSLCFHRAVCAVLNTYGLTQHACIDSCTLHTVADQNIISPARPLFRHFHSCQLRTVPRTNPYSNRDVLGLLDSSTTPYQSYQVLHSDAYFSGHIPTTPTSSFQVHSLRSARASGRVQSRRELTHPQNVQTVLLTNVDKRQEGSELH
jgi:hypothetical protein